MNKNILLFIGLLGLGSVSCSHQDFLLGDDSVEIQSSARKPASVEENYERGSTFANSPCSPLRELMGGNTAANYLRCNVVLNGQVVPEATYKVREADLCLATKQQDDQLQVEVSGQLPKLEEGPKNLRVRLTQRIPASGEKTELRAEESSGDGYQKIIYEAENEVLNYELFTKEDILLGIAEEPKDSVNTRLRCFPEVIYHAPH